MVLDSSDLDELMRYALTHCMQFISTNIDDDDDDDDNNNSVVFKHFRFGYLLCVYFSLNDRGNSSNNNNIF